MKLAVRQLRKSPGFSAVALVTLALGIGANTTAFTLLNRLLLQSLPYPEPDRLVQLWGTIPDWKSMPQAPGDFCDLRDQTTVFERLTCYNVSFQGSAAEPGKPMERVTLMSVTADFLPLFGIPPALGRPFTKEEETERAPRLILSHAYWKSHFGGDPEVVGRTLRFESKMATIVGVMPPLFDDSQLWGGKLDMLKLDFPDQNRTHRKNVWYSVAGRLKPGATLDQAQAQVGAIATRLAQDFPETNSNRGQRVERFAPDHIGDVGRNLIWLIMALAVAVLLIACVNLANLQLVRTTARSREYAVRLALGASRGQLVRLLLTESLLLAVVGGALSLAVAKWGNLAFARYLGLDLPLDARVLAFALLVATATGVAFGTIPAWMASRADINSALKQNARGSTSDRSRRLIRQGLVVAELALALTLLSGAGYFVRGIQRITDRELGWRPENVLVGRFALPAERYLSHHELPPDNADHERITRLQLFDEQFRGGLLQLPGVDAAAISLGSPAWGFNGMRFVVEGQPPPAEGAEPTASLEFATPGYLNTYGLHLLQGREFAASDGPEAPAVAIINQAMARKFWPEASAIGQRIRDTNPAGQISYEIVGVTNDIVPAGDLRIGEVRLQIYTPWLQRWNRFISFALHSAHDSRTLKDGVRRVLAEMEPDVAITFMDAAEDVIKSNVSTFTFVRRILTQLAVLGLLLSALGVYGVIANLAAERTPEVGIRMALGAQGRDVVWLFLSSGIRVALAGTVLGLLGAFGLLRVLNHSMAIVPGSDPWVVVAVAAVLFTVAVIACWLPARRATQVNPIIALRAE